MSANLDATFLSEGGLSALRALIERGVAQWCPADLPVLPLIWPHLERVLQVPLSEIRLVTARRDLGGSPELLGLNFSSEAVHTQTLPELICVLSAAFAHLLREEVEGKGPISQRRVEQVLRLYATPVKFPGSSLEEVMSALTPALWLDFRGQTDTHAFTFTPERFNVYDSEDAQHSQDDVPAERLAESIEELKERELFLNGIERRLFCSGERRGRRMTPKPYRTLRYILIKARLGSMRVENLWADVWGENEPKTSAWNETWRQLHGQTGGVLRAHIVNNAESAGEITVRDMPSHAVIWPHGQE